MRILATIRTFIINYLVPGWGLWIVGKPRLALATVVTIVGLVVLFSWSRLVLDPVAYLVLICLIIGLVFLVALYSAIIEFRRDEELSPPRNWKSAFIFAVISGVTLYVVMSDRSSTLGYDVFILPASSMAPTLVRGDHILADSWHYSESDILFGEIVVFEVPKSHGVMYVKRVVGLPGDNLSFEDNVLRRNGVPVDEPYAFYAAGPTRPASAFQNIRVPDGEYFVMGDNRNNSRDSRYIGTVPRSSIAGRVAHLWYSRDEVDGIQWQRFPAKID